MKQNLPIGIYEKALPTYGTWLERLQAARATGFDFVEMSVDESDERIERLDWAAADRSALRDAIDETGISVPTMCLSAHRRFSLGSASAVTRQQALDILRKAIDLASHIGIRIIQLAGYYVYYEERVGSSILHYRDGLAQGVEWASRSGVMLALENVDGNDVQSITRAMAFVQSFDSPWLQVYPDIGNLAEHDFDVCAELQRGRGHIVGIHVKDTRPGEPRRVPFGAGTVPFINAFGQLAAMNFAGPVVLEMWNDDSPNALDIVSRAREWVLDKMAQGGLVRAPSGW